MTLPDKQQRALRALRSGPTTSVEYARDIGVTRNSAEYGLKALCARGLAQRRLANANSIREGYVYSLTDEGLAWVSGPEPVAGVKNNPFLWRTYVQPMEGVRV